MKLGVSVRVLAAAICALTFLSAAKGAQEAAFNVDTILTDAELQAEFGSGSSASPQHTLAAPFSPAHDSVRDLMTAELLSYYDVILYINKAARGTTAQTMRVFTRAAGTEAGWSETQRMKVSTGREQAEQYFTTTPTGLFNIDGGRVFKMAYSAKWGGSPMPFAMFFDVQFTSRKTGIAIHGAPHGSEKKLGSRASGGCVRVGNKDVEALYNWILTNHAGEVPQFVFDPKRGKTSPEGTLQRNADGTVVMKKGYRVLVAITDVQD